MHNLSKNGQKTNKLTECNIIDDIRLQIGANSTLTMPQFLSMVGAKRAHKFWNIEGVSLSAVRQWRRMTRAPRPNAALQIIEKSGGLLDWEGIYLPIAQFRAES